MDHRSESSRNPNHSLFNYISFSISYLGRWSTLLLPFPCIPTPVSTFLSCSSPIAIPPLAPSFPHVGMVGGGGNYDKIPSLNTCKSLFVPPPARLLTKEGRHFFPPEMKKDFRAIRVAFLFEMCCRWGMWVCVHGSQKCTVPPILPSSPKQIPRRFRRKKKKEKEK